mmetsp:Transcript_9936/g.19172  ORF Transcript_9936/g.19172 Transcript_9936/m.19172 type:complete len:85 (-) Transcript_9936:1541-1795(-)
MYLENAENTVHTYVYVNPNMEPRSLCLLSNTSGDYPGLLEQQPILLCQVFQVGLGQNTTWLGVPSLAERRWTTAGDLKLAWDAC